MTARVPNTIGVEGVFLDGYTIALLGREDEPTDAVEEYCCYLGSTLRKHEFQ